MNRNLHRCNDGKGEGRAFAMLSRMVEQDENVTRLSLLTTGRIVSCTFRPMLSPEQYSELVEMVRYESLSETQMGMRLAELVKRWQVDLTIHTE